MGYNKKSPVVVDIGVPKTDFDAHLEENVKVNVVKFGAVGNANYYNSGDNKYYVDSGFITLAHDDTQAFIDAINYAKTHGGKVVMPKGRFWISAGKLPWYEGLTLEGVSSGWYFTVDSNYSRIEYTGTDYLFDDATVSDVMGFIKFRDFTFISNIGAGGFVDWNKGLTFTGDTGQKTLFRLEMNKAFLIKRVASSGALEGLGNACIDAVGLMNSMFNDCIFKGWDIALNIPQCDINEFNHCLFTGNAQITKLERINSWGTQNVFNDCDFEVRRNYTGDYQIVDKALYTLYQNCYFQQGVCADYTVTDPTPTHPTHNKIKGWIYSDNGEKNLIACRFDFRDGFFTEALFNIKKLGSMNFIGCTNAYIGYYENVGQKVIIEAQNVSTASDANKTINYGATNLIGCNSYFISYFDLEDKQVELVGRKKIDTINQGSLLTSPLFYDRNLAFSAIEVSSLVTDSKATRRQVYLLPATTTSGYGTLGNFKLHFTIGKNSIIRKNQTYDVRVRLRVDAVYTDPLPTVRVVRLDANRGFVATTVQKDIVDTAQSTDYKDYYVTFNTDTFAYGEIFQLLIYYKATANDANKKCYVEEVEFYNTTEKVYL